MNPRFRTLIFSVALLLIAPVAQSSAAPGLDETTSNAQMACTADPTRPEPVMLTPDVEVAGVQTSADDARQPGEADPFIINGGFGD
jgi:hypothetical protein